jgi:pimeloyl-ACP methyl ester carboxylesterase
MFKIESLLAARLFLAPQIAGDRLFFISNLSGRLSLYAMREGGSVPEPLVPPDIALQNPDLVGGYPYSVFPRLGKILVMLDHDGDENYQPMLIPLEGGFPAPAFGDFFAHFRVACTECDRERGIVYLSAESRLAQITQVYRGDLRTGELVRLDESTWGAAVSGASADHRQAVIVESYTVGDTVLYLWTEGGRSELLYGTPIGARAAGVAAPLPAIGDCHFVGDGLLLITALFEDTYGPGFLPLDGAREVRPVRVVGARHTGAGELVRLRHERGPRFTLEYNIDGCSWLYSASFDAAALTLTLDRLLVGEGELAGGVLESASYDPEGDRFALSFSTATSPTQLYVIDRAGGPRRQTNERVLGIPASLLSPGEDASFTSFDGLRISARLYLPSPELGFSGPRPLIYYVHGGPQSQERPNFAWFSMPLIQFLTLNGFAVFVPNARGSTGYGLAYTKRVDRDWGGADRRDHVFAMTKVLPRDPRLDTRRAGVVGRSYGGYMTLTLAARHPELWRAAVDMFGPYDLLTFMERIPETWKPYFAVAVGDPQRDRALLAERSPRSYIDRIACPLLVIQGKNDPRVIERESRDVVEQLRARGKAVEYLVFENEGHDVLKFENRVTCYNAITEFFRRHLL